jgi:hypothetical protein
MHLNLDHFRLRKLSLEAFNCLLDCGPELITRGCFVGRNFSLVVR